jgi:DsbC/DsbD-like thiol-disulfide interchange protein
MDEGWHSDWENPGDSGLATKIVWGLPEGLSASPA